MRSTVPDGKQTTDVLPDADAADSELTELLPEVVAVSDGAADRLLAGFSPDDRVRDRDGLFRALECNEELATPGLRKALETLRPAARWLEDDLETAPLPAGEYWVVDTVEGNVNHIHGLPEWCVTITLVRGGLPVLAVVRQPVGDRTYTAVRGGGARLGDTVLSVSDKQDLGLAIVATGQAEVGQATTYRRIGESITAMLSSALLVRATVPSTFPLLLVASGQNDVFWQFEPTLPGIAAGILLVTEAGGRVSRIDGSPWSPGSPDVLVTAPGLHQPAVTVLGTVT